MLPSDVLQNSWWVFVPWQNEKHGMRQLFWSARRIPKGELDGLAGQVAALARLQSETAAALDALLPSVLDKAFKGEL